ncbi:hypothetical protein B9Z55_015395 [Caenorhabditis nigoni]|uniref:F-box domain-containing protein n=1 Tax=Caenorhabditis nigoni TaxID=1611254 RepID=A0A2G5UA18_9PELO|nr:hypothetical protein B9Z55_015395 [Caenorhabditis nigoni]
MRIRSYPNLINQQIIQEMDPSENFMLSKTSKKMKDLVKKYIYKVDQVWIDFNLNVAFVIEIDGKFYNVLVPCDDPKETMGCRTSGFPMRLRSYPNLINQQIIQEMDPSANFMLAKTSKKMKDLVKKYIYKVDQVWIDFNLNVAFVIEIDGKYYNVLVPCDDPRGTMGCRSLVNTVMIYSSAAQKYHEIHPNHNDICEIFKCDSNRISVVDSTLCTTREFPQDVINRNQFFMNVDFCILKIFKELSSCMRPACMKIPNLIIDDTKYFVSYFILNHEGQNIVLKDAWLNDDYVRIFILHWMLKTRESLVSFIAFQNRQEVFDESSVVNFLNSKRDAITESRVEDWDPEKRDRIANHHVFPADTFDCEHGYDIVREDGKRATVKVSPNYFMFFVWP